MTGIEGPAGHEERPAAELVAGLLRSRIIDGSFRLGEQLTEASLVQALKVSRGPVREALQRLSQEGLVVGRRNHGVFVLDLSVEDILEIYAARRAVETAAAAEVIGAGDEARHRTVGKLGAVLRQMPAAVAARDWNKAARLDISFHEVLVDGSGSSRLVRMFNTLSAESRICMVHIRISHHRFDALVAEHQEMADLLAAKDADGLNTAIVRHVETAATDLVESLQAAPPQSTSGVPGPGHPANRGLIQAKRMTTP